MFWIKKLFDSRDTSSENFCLKCSNNTKNYSGTNWFYKFTKFNLLEILFIDLLLINNASMVK